LSDYNIGGIPDGRELRDKAIRWLKKKGTADLAAENARLLARVAALEKAQPKRKRKEMPAEQRALLSVKQKALRAKLKALEEASIAAAKSENPVSGEEVLPAG
jgi:cobalamin biosynthesis Mg chelatase CobN